MECIQSYFRKCIVTLPYSHVHRVTQAPKCVFRALRLSVVASIIYSSGTRRHCVLFTTACADAHPGCVQCNHNQQFLCSWRPVIYRVTAQFIRLVLNISFGYAIFPTVSAPSHVGIIYMFYWYDTVASIAHRPLTWLRQCRCLSHFKWKASNSEMTWESHAFLRAPSQRKWSEMFNLYYLSWCLLERSIPMLHLCAAIF